MCFSQQKNGCSAAFEPVILDLKRKIYWLVFSLLFGIVHVQLASADVFLTELVTFKALQMSALLQVSPLLRATVHRLHLSLVDLAAFLTYLNITFNLLCRYICLQQYGKQTCICVIGVGIVFLIQNNNNKKTYSQTKHFSNYICILS